MPWTKCEDCVHEPKCDWPHQLYGGCECGDPKKKEKKMDAIDKILCELIVSEVGGHGFDLVKLGNAMVNDSGDEMDKFGIELLQIANHTADWCNKIVAASDPEGAKELQVKFDALKSRWEEDNPGVPFLR